MKRQIHDLTEWTVVGGREWGWVSYIHLTFSHWDVWQSRPFPSVLRNFVLAVVLPYPLTLFPSCFLTSFFLRSLSRFTSNKLFGKGEAEKNNANKITQYFRLSSKHSLFGGEHGKFLMTFRKTFVFTPLAATTADELKKTFSSNVTCKAKSIFCTISCFFVPFSRGNLFIFFFAQYE